MKKDEEGGRMFEDADRKDFADILKKYDSKQVEPFLTMLEFICFQMKIWKDLPAYQDVKEYANPVLHTFDKTINYLNTHFGEMIEMEKFLHNLQYTEQLTHHEREMLLMAYKDNGIELFARSFSHIMKENCRRQLLKEGLPDVQMLPLVCSDGNLRSHKEKGQESWNTCYDNQSLNKMINISSDQVYQSYQKSLMIFGKERNKVFKQIKQDNHSQQEQKMVLLKSKSE